MSLTRKSKRKKGFSSPGRVLAGVPKGENYGEKE